MQWSPERNSSRIHIAVPVRIRGHDVNGDSFDREAWTLNVSRQGACLHIPEDLALPHRLRIVSNDYQFHADAEVVVIWERQLPQRAIGVRVMPDTPSTAWQAR